MFQLIITKIIIIAVKQIRSLTSN